MTPGMCEQCGERPATVHLTQVVNGQKSEHRLCESCAQAAGTVPMMGAWNLGHFLGGLMVPARGPVEGADAPRCPHCGWTPARFQETGRFGCDRCYETFQQDLVDLVRRIHGSTEHQGKIPARAGVDLRREHELNQLKAELGQAVRDEAFERAAELRDRIRQLERWEATE
jgi:protein arginine kinase activator